MDKPIYELRNSEDFKDTTITNIDKHAYPKLVELCKILKKKMYKKAMKPFEEMTREELKSFAQRTMLDCLQKRLRQDIPKVDLHNYAKKRLMKDLKEVNALNLPYIVAEPYKKNLFEWHINLLAPPSSKYYGICMHLIARFTDEYPFLPPKIEIMTPLTHSHVFGRWICLDLLNTHNSNESHYGWSVSYSITSILYQLQSFLLEEEDKVHEWHIMRNIKGSINYSCDCGHNFANGKPFPWNKRWNYNIENMIDFVKVREKLMKESEIDYENEKKRLEKLTEMERLKIQSRSKKKEKEERMLLKHQKNISKRQNKLKKQYIMYKRKEVVELLKKKMNLERDRDFCAFGLQKLKENDKDMIEDRIDQEKQKLIAKEKKRRAKAEKKEKNQKRGNYKSQLKVLLKKRNLLSITKEKERIERKEINKKIAMLKRRIKNLNKAPKTKKMQNPKEKKEEIKPEEPKIALEDEETKEFYDEEVIEIEEQKPEPKEEEKENQEEKEQEKEEEIKVEIDRERIEKEVKEMISKKIENLEIKLKEMEKELENIEKELEKEKKIEEKQRKEIQAQVQKEIKETEEKRKKIKQERIAKQKEKEKAKQREEEEYRKLKERFKMKQSRAQFSKKKLIAAIENVKDSEKIDDDQEEEIIIFRIKEHIPKDIMINIFSFFEKKELHKLAKVNDEFAEIAMSPVFWEHNDLRCYYSKMTFTEAVLGIGLSLKYSRSTNKLLEISTPLDLLSYFSFHIEKIRLGVFNEVFTHFLPIYISEKHWRKGEKIFRKTVKDIYRIKKNQTQGKGKNRELVYNVYSIDLISKLMNSMIVFFMKESTHASMKALQGYSYFHRLLLEFTLASAKSNKNQFGSTPNKESKILDQINYVVEQFIAGNSHKTVIPSLGEMIPLIGLSKFSWEEVKVAFVREAFKRNCFWIQAKTRKNVYFTNLERDSKEELKELLSECFEAVKVSLKLICFHVVFLKGIYPKKKNFAALKSMGKQYDNRFGTAPEDMKVYLQDSIKKIQNINSFSDFFKFIEWKEWRSKRGYSDWQCYNMIKYDFKGAFNAGYFKKTDNAKTMILNPEWDEKDEIVQQRIKQAKAKNTLQNSQGKKWRNGKSQKRKRNRKKNSADSMMKKFREKYGTLDKPSKRRGNKYRNQKKGKENGKKNFGGKKYQGNYKKRTNQGNEYKTTEKNDQYESYGYESYDTKKSDDDYTSY